MYDVRPIYVLCPRGQCSVWQIMKNNDSGVLLDPMAIDVQPVNQWPTEH